MPSLLRRHPVLAVFAAVGLALVAATATRLLSLEGPERASTVSGDVLVTLAPARMEVVVDEIEAIGTTEANEAITVTAKVTETVQRVNFEDGQLVQRGDVLVELTNAVETAQLAESRSSLRDAQTQFERLQDLVAQQSAPRARLDEARNALAGAQARLDAILARLDDRLIRAPFTGMLGFRSVSPGTLVVPSTAITTLDDIRIIKLDFSVPEVFVSDLRPALDVTARSPAFPEREFAGTVSSVSPRVDPVTRAVTVRALIPNDDLALRPGMLMTVKLVRSRAPSLVVPEAALIQVQDRKYVYTLDAERRARQIPVRIGRRRPGLVEILQGLEPGEQVVTEGMAQLRPGASVRIHGGSSGAVAGDASGGASAGVVGD